MFRKLTVFAATALFFVACSSTPQEKSVDNMMDMQRDKSELNNSGLVAGLGVGESASEQMAYDEADLNARTDVARQLESKIEAFFRNYQEEVGNELAEHQETARKNIISSLQNGVTIVKMKMDIVNERYKVYAIAALDPKALKEALEAEMSARKANMDRVKAMKAYQTLDEEAKKLDEYKLKAAGK